MAKFKTEKHKKQNSLPNSPSLSSAVSKIKQKFSFLKWLDPFTYVDLFVIPQIKKVTNSVVVEFLVNVFFALLFAWIIYTLLGAIFGTSTPLVIVYSASMENTFFRGDVMALGKVSSTDYFGPEIKINQNVAGIAVNNYLNQSYDSYGNFYSFRIGGEEFLYKKDASIIVYPAYNPTSLDHGKPIIHRTIAKLAALDGNFVLTKGDNSLSNKQFDQDCGNISQGFEKPDGPCITLYAIPLEQIQGKTFFMIPKVGCVKLWLVDDLFPLMGNVVLGRERSDPQLKNPNWPLPPDFKGIC